MNNPLKDTSIKPKYTNKLLVFISLILVSICGLPSEAGAAEKLTLTVTPPLFQLTIGPGEFWASSLKVVNTNPYDLTVYASVMNFEAQGESGQGKFIPLTEMSPDLLPHTLAGWIETSAGPIFIPREKSAEVPFTVRIPKDASPGGHYAAILVGTKPVLDSKEGSAIGVSSMVSSLFFVRIGGKVREEGDIREFSTEQRLYQKPEVKLILRFENKGNVHLQPQGEIVIYNMWGRERGKIPINHKTEFGNVLPRSIRKWEYEWKGEENFFETGIYTVVVTLTFGKESRQNVFRTTSFWVIPIKPTLITLGSFFIIIIFTAVAIRAYIRRSLMLAQKHFGLSPLSLRGPYRQKFEALAQPPKEGVIDLRNVRRGGTIDIKDAREIAPRLSLLAFTRRYYKFFAFLLILTGGVLWLVVYFQNVLVRTRSFEVTTPQEEKERIMP